MEQAIRAPHIEEPCPQTFTSWEVTHDEEAGLGQAVEKRSFGHRQSSRHMCFHSWHTHEGDSVHPGKKLVELEIDGVVTPIFSVVHGIVSDLVPMDENTVVKPFDILLNIHPRPDRSSRTKGLVPKPSTYQRFLRFGR
jgi:hypothetical protein